MLDSDHAAPDESSIGANGTEEKPRELFIIDERIGDPDSIVAKLVVDGAAAPEVVTLDRNQSGISQIAEILTMRSMLAKLHIIPHAIDDGMQVGTDWFTRDVLISSVAEVSAWGPALAAGATIVLYGCNLEATVEGRGLRKGLGALTGAQIAGRSVPGAAAKADPSPVEENDGGDDDLSTSCALTDESGTIFLGGTFTATPNAALRLEFVAPSEEEAGDTEADGHSLGFAFATTDDTGVAAFRVALSVKVAVGTPIKVLATDSRGVTTPLDLDLVAVGGSIPAPSAVEEDVCEEEACAPDVCEPVACEPEVDEPEVCEPEVCEPEVCEPDVCEPEVCEPEVCEPEVCEPEVCEPDVCEPDVCEPDVCEPDVCEPEVCEPEVCEPEVCEPEVCEPEVCEPEVCEPEVCEPEVCEPEVCEPEVCEPEVCEPEVCEPEVCEPEVCEPEVCEPEVCEPELCEPEVCEPEVCEPEVCEPEVCEPEVCEPELCEPEVCEPEVCEPEVCEPEVCEPEVCEPELCEPEACEPEACEPEVCEPDEHEPEAYEAEIHEAELCEPEVDEHVIYEAEACEVEDEFVCDEGETEPSEPELVDTDTFEPESIASDSNAYERAMDFEPEIDTYDMASYESDPVEGTTDEVNVGTEAVETIESASRVNEPASVDMVIEPRSDCPDAFDFADVRFSQSNAMLHVDIEPTTEPMTEAPDDSPIPGKLNLDVVNDHYGTATMSVRSRQPDGRSVIGAYTVLARPVQDGPKLPERSADANEPVFSVAAIPPNSRLLLHGRTLTVGETFTASDAAGGGLVYAHGDQSERSESFRFMVSDGVGQTLRVIVAAVIQTSSTMKVTGADEAAASHTDTALRFATPSGAEITDAARVALASRLDESPRRAEINFARAGDIPGAVAAAGVLWSIRGGALMAKTLALLPGVLELETPSDLRQAG